MADLRGIGRQAHDGCGDLALEQLAEHRCSLEAGHRGVGQRSAQLVVGGDGLVEPAELLGGEPACRGVQLAEDGGGESLERGVHRTFPAPSAPEALSARTA